MLGHAEQLAKRGMEPGGLGRDSLVIELASNDGYLLQFYQQAGVPVLGIEPAANIAEAGRKRGINTLTKFFGTEVPDELHPEGTLAAVWPANTTLPHLSHPNAFLPSIANASNLNG